MVRREKEGKQGLRRAVRRKKQGVKEGWRRVLRRKEAGWKGERESRVERGESKVERKDIEQGAKEGWRGVVRREEQSGTKE